MSTETITHGDSYELASTWLTHYTQWKREYSAAEFESLTKAAMEKMEEDFKKQFNEEISLYVDNKELLKKLNIVEVYLQMKASLVKGGRP